MEYNLVYIFSNYLEDIKENIDLQDEAAQKHGLASGGYPFSRTFFAVAEAARVLAESDKWLKKVCLST